MTPDEHIDALLEQGAVLVRTAPHLFALVEHLRGRKTLSEADALAHAEALDGLGYAYPRRKKPLVDDVVPVASAHVELVPVARRALAGDKYARAEVLDAWQFFVDGCNEMKLPRHSNNAGEAFVARELQRVALDERRRGVDGPACRLVADIPALAKLAREKGIDPIEWGSVDRWRKRLAAHTS